MAKKRGRPPKKRVSILCPGKSLHTHKGPFEGKVIAVTDALFHERGCDVWCYQEGPQHPHQGRFKTYGSRVQDLKCTIWGVKGSAHRWGLWGLLGVKVHEDMNIEDLIQKLPWVASVLRVQAHAEAKPGSGPRNLWYMNKKRNGGPALRSGAGSPTVHAILRAVMDGAEKIDLYGWDLEGHGNWDPRTGERVLSVNTGEPVHFKTPEWWEAKWKGERAIRKDLVEEAKKHGVTITVHAAARKTRGKAKAKDPSTGAGGGDGLGVGDKPGRLVKRAGTGLRGGGGKPPKVDAPEGRDQVDGSGGMPIGAEDLEC